MQQRIFIVVLAVLCSCVYAGQTRWHQLNGYTFDDYVQEFGKRYTSEVERTERKAIFDATLEKIKAHNQDATKTWKEGVNHLTDQRPEEFKKLLGYKSTLIEHNSARIVKPSSDLTISSFPTRVDWRERGIITAVKDQGGCGSCWAFATAETVESHYALANGAGVLTDLSIQQILDCTPNPLQCGGTGGCSGATAEIGMASIQRMGGLVSEWVYPYQSHAGQNFNCSTERINRQVGNITAVIQLPPNEYLPLISSVANVGPIAISVDASSWKHYESGVYNGCNQTNPDIDHAVQLVGYGTDPKLGDYWLVRNSWTALWGEGGYVRIYRTSEVTCGTDTTPGDGTGCKGGPPTQTVCGTCGILFDSSYPVIIAE